jgi:undecaprenyl phosphate-alpha-L-ara4FN deformylase
VRGEATRCAQIPSTLPTLDELIGLGGLTPDNVHEHLLKLSENAASPHGHVYTLHAELEGMKLEPVFECLLKGWRARGDELVATREVAANLRLDSLPHHNIVWCEVPGRSGVLAAQGAEFLAA